MTRTETSGPDRLSKRRSYRRLMFGSVVAGTIGFVAAESAGYPVVGVGLYWLGFLAFLAVWRGTSLTLFDERDRVLERRASALTLTLTAFGLVAAWPTLLVLSEVGVYSPPPAFDGVLFGFSAQAALFGVAYLWLRYRP